MKIIPSELAAYIDHTLLKPDSTVSMVQQLCAEARDKHFCCVCVLPSFVSLAKELLSDSTVKVCTVIGFPLGANETEVKAYEARMAVANGADEIDMVINIGAVKSGKFNAVKTDIQSVKESTQGRLLKVILETCLLNDEEKIQACKVSVEAGADFVKTSTGFSSGGATVEDVRLMRQTVAAEIGVKASGGIRDYQTACDMVEAGANRLGTSSGLVIVGTENNSAGGGY